MKKALIFAFTIAVIYYVLAELLPIWAYTLF